MKTTYEHIHFIKSNKVWRCHNNESSNELGQVKWHPQWEQYTYSPAPQTVYRSSSITNIAHFIAHLPTDQELLSDRKANEPTTN